MTPRFPAKVIHQIGIHSRTKSKGYNKFNTIRYLRYAIAKSTAAITLIQNKPGPSPLRPRRAFPPANKHPTYPPTSHHSKHPHYHATFHRRHPTASTAPPPPPPELPARLLHPATTNPASRPQSRRREPWETSPSRRRAGSCGSP